jgi:ribosomal protein S12 methylthiotransferase accessory factor
MSLPRDLQAALEPREVEHLVDVLVSPQTGLIEQVYKTLVQPDEPPLHYFAARMGATERYITREAVRHVGGAGWTHWAGLASLMGEAAERYALWFVHHASERRAPAAALADEGADFVGPEAFHLFSPRQYGRGDFPYRPLPTDQEEIGWIQGIDLATGHPTWVPSALALLPEGLRPITTTGTACSRHPAAATLAALLELVERDALAIAWYNRLSCPPVETTMVEGLDDVLDRFFRPTRVPYHLFHLPTDLEIPAVLAVALAGQEDLAAVHVGAAAGPTLRAAVFKALLEAAQCRPYAKFLGRGSFNRADDVLSFQDHVRFWNDRTRIRDLDFLLFPARRFAVPAFREWFGCGEDVLPLIVTHLTTFGIRLIRLDITPQDLREVGLTVVRVVSPPLVDIDSAHGSRQLGQPRIYQVPVQLGYLSRPPGEEDLNPLPHPFP